jgi:regulator of sigma E protease
MAHTGALGRHCGTAKGRYRLITVVSFVIVLGVLVFFHELGHYWVARRNGIVVEEFGMGYPPRLVKLFTYDGTDFTINLIPFGGFARMRGEDARDMSPGSFNAAGRGARAMTLIAGPGMNALLAIILFAASFMAGFPAPVAAPQLPSDLPTEITAETGLEPGDILLEVNDQPVQVSAIPDMNFRVLDTERAERSAGDGGSVLTVSRDGQLVDVVLPAQLSTRELLERAGYVSVLATQITLIAEESPAEAAGLQPGDLFYKVDDTLVTSVNPLNELIERSLGEEITLTILRGDEWLQVPITPRVNPPEGQGALGVGIAPTTQLATLSLLQSLWQGVLSTFEYFFLVLQLPFLLIQGQIAPSDAELVGPFGIADMVGDAMSATLQTGIWYPILRLSAVLSAALAVTNMLPLPALDGGRLLFILIETIRGRRVNPEREGLVHMVGFVLLLGLIALITVRDISSTREGIDWISILGQ